MQLAYRWISRDLGRAEFVFSIIIISIFLGTIINKSLQLFALAERNLVKASVINIQTALQLQSAIQSIRNNNGNMIEITEGMNPVTLMQAVPDNYNQYVGSNLAYVRANQISVRPITNYLGEMYDPDIDSLDRGNWYFDYNGNLFIYLLKYSEYFGDSAGGPTELRYSVQLDYTDVDNNQLYEVGKDILKSVSFVNMDMNK